jgi:GntR family histidine utilization transcriptional repressor
MVQYGCARMTVNRALSVLATAGLIDRNKRAGSFVAQPKLHSMILDIPDLKQEVLLRGQSYRFDLLDRAIRRIAPDDRDYAGLRPGKVLCLLGRHYANNQELAVERRGVSLRAVPEIERAKFDAEPPGSWLLHHVPWIEAETRISAAAADPEMASLLHIDVGAPLLQIERRTWRGADQITWVRQSFRAEAYDLFARFGAHDRAAR